MNQLDRHSRDSLCTAIEDYLSRRIDNHELERRMFAIQTNDPACKEIAREMCFFSSEFRRHTNTGSARITFDVSTIIDRWLAFLRSDAEWPVEVRPPGSKFKRFTGAIKALLTDKPDVPQFRINEFWPFESQDGWSAILACSRAARCE